MRPGSIREHVEPILAGRYLPRTCQKPTPSRRWNDSEAEVVPSIKSILSKAALNRGPARPPAADRRVSNSEAALNRGPARPPAADRRVSNSGIRLELEGLLLSLTTNSQLIARRPSADRPRTSSWLSSRQRRNRPRKSWPSAANSNAGSSGSKGSRTSSSAHLVSRASCARRGCPARKVGKRLFFRVAEVDAFLEREGAAA
jgi:hypothetical protein